MLSVMDCERSVIIMTLIWLVYIVYGLGNCVDDTSTETDLLRRKSLFLPEKIENYFRIAM